MFKIPRFIKTASSTSRRNDAALVAELVALAGCLTLSPEDLDDLVYEATNDVAADRFNTGEWPARDEEHAYAALHNDADLEASQINNGGLQAQIAYLLAGGDAQYVRDLLRDLAEDCSPTDRAGDSRPRLHSAIVLVEES